MVVSSLPFPVDKDRLRRDAMERRKEFVRTLDDPERTRLERRLAFHLTSVLANARVVAGYAALGSEISPVWAMEEARAVGAVAAYPAFHNPTEPFRFLGADPNSVGLFGINQPPLHAAEVTPDVVLVPLVAIDPAGTRLGRGKGHYDRVLTPLKRNGAHLIGVGWSFQMIEEIPPDPWDVPLDAFASPDGLIRFVKR
ncbi:5-formyltetrahydrofolate cyclo-ligase [Sphingomonas piscis]|uniref:5-formyltetrahydrofolate cyclo-ligase n=1 Tax=Sphingomonas piscis TaxID=2714943 RepID=A0A6G7YSK2_9SPHN|nr:5-formyltetrahydrofolate cyclo-ligase [Sphingomonas piscis]QIK79728.1 5-formyltetrahydrofolate cyclo-ligase [Sphingomonas piscis]